MDLNRKKFVLESNAIEGVHRQPTPEEKAAHSALWDLEVVGIDDLKTFVNCLSDTTGAELRSKKGMDVRVGNHFPPPGGQRITDELVQILADASLGEHPYLIHQAYEQLHPFMDGNGRSGRALWAWQMLKQGHCHYTGLRRGFLHQFYYQALDFWRNK